MTTALRSGLRSSLLVSTVFLAAASAHAAGLRGRALDPDDRPVAGAEVIVTRGVAVVATATTDSAGDFRVTDLPAGELSVTASRDGLRARPTSVNVDSMSAEEREITLHLEISAVAESVVVSASQVDVPLTRVPDSVTVLDAATLEARQIDTLADGLRLVPGITVSRSGGPGGLTSVFPRGGESDYTLVLIDGVPANAFGGSYDFAHLGAAGVERLEVVRGPQSALFGGNAIGTVVSVVSRRGDPARVDGSVEGGGLGTWRVDGSAAGSHREWSGAIAAERLESDGFTGIAPATGEPVTNDDYQRHLFGFGGGWQGTRGRGVDVRLRLSGSERGFPGPFGSNPAGIYTNVDRLSRGQNDEVQFGVEGRIPTGERWRHRAHFTFGNFDSEFVSQFDPQNPTTSGSRRVTGRVQSDVDLSAPLGVSFGAEFQQEQAENTFIVGEASTGIPIDRGVAGYFGEARYAQGRLVATGGLRVEQIRRDALEGDPNGFQPRPAFPADTVWSTNPRVSVLWYLAAPHDRGWTKLRASAGTGIRPPSAFEIGFTDNPGLKPERSQSVEAGVEQGFAKGAAVATATVFFNDYDDLIIAVGRSLVDASRFRTDNIANARARGVELAAVWRAKTFAATGSYTFLDTEILAVDRLPGQAPAPFEVGDPLLRRPRHQGLIDFTFTHGRLTAFAMGIARGEVLDVEPSFGASAGLFEAPGYFVMSAGGAWRIAESVSVYGRVANLFDREYEEAFGFPSPGRTGYAGVRVAIGK